MGELACYNEGMQIMSMAGMELFQNLTSRFLGSETYQSLENIPELSVYIRGTTRVNPKQFGGLNIAALLPHLLLTIVLVVVVSRVLHFCLRFLKQPLIVCQVIAGILIFSLLPRPSSNDPIISDNNVGTYSMLFEPTMKRLENAFGYIGVVFYFFMVGVKMDPSTVWSTGKKRPIIIGLSSLFASIAVTLLISLVFHNHLEPFYKKQNYIYVIFELYLYCSTYFPCVAEVLTELGLLNSELGRMALSCTVAQAFAGWTFQLAFTVITQGKNNWRIGLYTFMSALAIVFFIILVIRPCAQWIVRVSTPNGRISHMHMFMIVFTAVVVAFVSDTLGTVVTDGAVIMGLALPKGPPLGTALMERVDLVSTELFLPIILVKELGYLMSWEGVKKNLILWFWVEVVLVLSFIFRTVATMAAAVYCNMSVKNGFLLGLIMNFRGLVEVLTCMRFVGLGLLDSATFAMVVVSTVTITSVCAPLVSIYYKPLSGKKQMGHLTVQRLWSNAELRVMTCFYNDKPVPALLHLLESCVPEQSSTCIYALHLVKLQGRAASTLITHRNKKGIINPEQMDHVHNYFLTFGENKKSVVVLPFTSIAPAKTMHQDACTLILERNIAFVVVPFPKINSMADVETSFTMRSLVPLLLEQAPCSVGILVYHGMTTITMPTKDWKYRVCVLFWGGPDDREVISVACRLARHHQVYLEVLRFCASSETESHEQNVNDFGEIAHDDAVIRKLQAENIENTRVVVNEIHVRNLEEVLLMIRNIGDQNYDLIIVGRRQNNSAMPGEDGLSGWTQFPELGVMGDMLATDVSGTSNLLIVQQNSSS